MADSMAACEREIRSINASEPCLGAVLAPIEVMRDPPVIPEFFYHSRRQEGRLTSCVQRHVCSLRL
jgi:hypothetical protein